MEARLFWANNSFLVVDTETTGLDFKEDRIIQLAMAVFLRDENVYNFNYYSNDPKPSDPAALAVHGITDDFRKENGVSPRTIIDAVSSCFNKMRAANRPILAFNAPFDFSMIRAEFARQHRTFHWEGLNIIDPLVIDRHYEKNVPVFTKPFMRLQYMAARYGVIPPSHDAIDDAICTGHLAYAQSIHYPFIRHSRPRAIHEAEKEWYAAWVAKASAFATKKNFEFNTPSWPFGD